MKFEVGDRVMWVGNDYYDRAYIPPNVRGTVLGIKTHSDFTDFSYVEWNDPQSIEELGHPVLSERIAVRWDNGFELLHDPFDLTQANILERLSEIE